MWIFCLLIRLRQIMGYMEKIKIPIIKPQEVQVAVTHWIAGWFHSRIRRMDIYFDNIRKCNYFLEQVLPKYEAGAIGGNEVDVKQYIGEIYFLRAHEYFKRLQLMGISRL